MTDNLLIKEFLSLVEPEGYEETYSKDIREDKFFGMPLQAILDSEKRLRAKAGRNLAYFSMEYGLATSFYNKFSSSREIHTKNKLQESEVFSNHRLADYFFTFKIEDIIDLPIYSGGLGVLAGDTIKTMADYKLPVAGAGMLWNTGYFRQKFWFKYGQVPEEMHWDPNTYPGLIPLKTRIKISLKSEDIHLRLWKYYVYSYRRDYAIPLILLDSNIEPNSEKVKHLTDQLYRSDDVRIKVMQRVILGLGGVAAFDALGYNIDTFHLNEGHAVFAFIAKARGVPKNEIEKLKKHFVYTCHTPVEAGHDRFSADDLRRILKDEDFEVAQQFGRERGDGVINLTLLSMNIAHRINAVSRGHQEVMHVQFPKYKDQIQYVTNGVHMHTWASQRFMRLYEKYDTVFKDVKDNPMILAKAKGLKANPQFRADLWQAHQENKSEFCSFFEKWGLDKDAFTLCWARRIAAYKRPSLILQDVNKLIEIARKSGPIQIILAGKAHPSDNLGFTFINNMLDKIDELTGAYDALKIVMLENYDIHLANLLVSSVDVWLNNPLPPFEASGTSGMKAILNGVVQVSTLDGWVKEAEDKNIGKIFGYRSPPGSIGNEHELHIDEDSRQLYATLEEMVKLYYKTNKKGSIDLSSAWIDSMIDCIAAGAEFNTYRMLDQYKKNIWGIE